MPERVAVGLGVGVLVFVAVGEFIGVTCTEVVAVGVIVWVGVNCEFQVGV